MTPARALRTIVPAALLALLAGGLTAPVAQAAAAPAASATSAKPTGGHGIGSRAIEVEVGNSLDQTIPCLPPPDGKLHTVRGRLVGPTKVLEGHAGPTRINVLVHDTGTGAWFWNLKQVPAYDYATQLAKRGETSLVIDRLGFGSSPLKDGNKTCVDAQVHMLYQIIEHLYSGIYSYTGKGARDVSPPHAGSIVVQGHGFGATLAQLEAARYSNTAGLVLLAPQSTSPTALATRTLREQGVTCLAGATFAPFGATKADYRKLLFHTATSAVTRAASAKRNSTPCGEVAGIASGVIATTTAAKLDVPVLVLRGGDDSRNNGSASVSSSEKVTRHTIKGAGSALVLEKSAAQTRRDVLSWLKAL